MSTAQFTVTPGSLLPLAVLTPRGPTRWVHGLLEVVTHPYHINHLSRLTVTWHANHTVTSTSVSVTFPHDASTHSFLSLTSSHLFSRAASLLGSTFYLHSLPDQSIPVLSSKEVLYFMLASQSHRLCTCSCVMATPGGSNLSSPVSQTASLNFIQPQNGSLQARGWDSKFWSDFWAQRCILVECGRAHAAGQHLVAVATWLLGLVWWYQLACG